MFSSHHLLLQIIVAALIITGAAFILFWTYIRYMRISKDRNEDWYRVGFWTTLGLFVGVIVTAFILAMIK